MHHVVCLLLVAWLKAWNHSKLRIEARVLLVLRGVHGWVIGCHYNKSSVNARDGCVHKGICANIHTHMLHADKCTFAYIRHTECTFHGSLLVGCPLAENLVFTL